MLVSSYSVLPDESFEGYAFVGADFIAESEGYTRFRSNGGSIRPGEDGCYTILRRTPSGHEAGTDASESPRVWWRL